VRLKKHPRVLSRKLRLPSKTEKQRRNTTYAAHRRAVKLTIASKNGRTRRTLRVSNFSHYCNFTYSVLACLRMEMSGSASFQSTRKSL
jgi:hypothetical protein